MKAAAPLSVNISCVSCDLFLKKIGSPLCEVCKMRHNWLLVSGTVVRE
jgi:hypothetical protein